MLDWLYGQTLAIPPWILCHSLAPALPPSLSLFSFIIKLPEKCPAFLISLFNTTDLLDSL